MSYINAHTIQVYISLTQGTGDGLLRRFIVVESDPVVRLDLEGLLSNAFAGCSVVSAVSVTGLEPLINDSGAETTLLIRENLFDADGDLIDRLATAARDGLHIVIIGDQQAVPFPASTITVPFTDDSVIEALQNPGNTKLLPDDG